MSKKHKTKHKEEPKTKEKYSNLKKIYLKEYKKLLIIPLALFVFSSLILITTYLRTGDIMQRDVTLKGGISLTINNEISNLIEFENYLNNKFPEASLNLRTLESGGRIIGVIIEASDIDENSLLSAVQERIPNADYSLETMGSSLGESFFQQMFKALIVTFLFMGAVFFFYFAEKSMTKWIVLILSVTNFLFLFSNNNFVFWLITIIISITTLYLYIRYNLPTLAALASAFLDIYITVGLIQLMGIKMTAGGIAAYLMLIGYSIDTSILLSTKLLKGTDLEKNLFGAMKTGLTMSAAGIAATGISFLLTNNLILKQIMLILVIGLIIDLITTWIANVSLLRIYLENVES